MSFYESERIYCVIMRAGTSKGIFLHENDLPADPALRDKVILSIFGSPDPRQIDGLGGADTLTSKLAIIGPSSCPDADVNFTFGQVEINNPKIHYSGLCGNISSGVAPYAIEEGLVKAVEPVTTVRIHNTNSGNIYLSEVQVRNGKPRVEGDYAIDGVPGTGSRINIDMLYTYGSVNGRLLPTGNIRDEIDVPGLGKIDVSIVDVPNPCIFVKASDVGLKGTETPAEFNKNRPVIEILEEIRAIGADMLGFKNWREAEVKDPNPFVAAVAPPQDYLNHLTSTTVSADNVDFLSRLLFLGALHQTYAGSITVVTGVAAVIPGSVVNDVTKMKKGQKLVRIGHPGGIIEMEAEVEKPPDGQVKLTRAMYSRTARRIMDGYVFVPRKLLE
ncbi:MAG: PrpF domain-containing protein [Bacillota bacterium]|nr:PrpF domain-containing protein [Bacillota bacterium]